MIVKEINNFEIKYFKVERGEEELPFNETECFEYYRNIGYKVYFGYGNVIRERASKNKLDAPKNNYQKMLREIPEFSKEVVRLFKNYKNGEPDILIEKDGIWEFVEVKTTNDSLRPNQLVFIEELSKVRKVSIHHFIEVKNGVEAEMLTKNNQVKVKKVKTVILSKETKTLNKNSNLKSFFEKELLVLTKTQIKKNFKKYWIVSKIYALFPEFAVTLSGVELINKYTGIENKAILWYIDKNKKVILEDALQKLNKNSKISAREIKLIKEYKKLLIR